MFSSLEIHQIAKELGQKVWQMLETLGMKEMLFWNWNLNPKRWENRGWKQIYKEFSSVDSHAKFHSVFLVAEAYDRLIQQGEERSTIIALFFFFLILNF